MHQPTRRGPLGPVWKGKKAVEPVCMVQIGWRPDAELNMDIPTVHKTPSGTSVEMCMHVWAAWCVVFSGSWSELGV